MMSTKDLILECGTEKSAISRGVIHTLDSDGGLIVLIGDQLVMCDWLTTTERDQMRIGDRVLIYSDGECERAVVIGTIVDAGANARFFTPIDVSAGSGLGQSTDMPHHLILEARDQVTLRVGEGSITIRKDGKILIKGKDLVSHAQQSVRIKGGSVAIN